MKIFIDFDDVLFNTRDFSRNYKKIFEECGVCKDIFHELYYDYPQKDKTGKLKKYDYNKHVTRIGEECQMDTRELQKKVSNLISNTSKYLFPDVLDFLKAFNRSSLFLVSFGKTEFQKSKIMNSGIKDFFQEINIVDELKSGPISRFAKNDEKIYFLDDRIEQVEDVKKNFPKSVTFLVDREEGRFDDEHNEYCDFVVKDLKEALGLIK